MNRISFVLIEGQSGGERRRGGESAPIKAERRGKNGTERYVLTRAPFGGEDITAEILESGTHVHIEFRRNLINDSKLFIDRILILGGPADGIRGNIAHGIRVEDPISGLLMFDRGSNHIIKVEGINGNKSFEMKIFPK